jgi:hypothetical protein
MDMTLIIIISLVLFAVVVTMQALAITRSVKSIKKKKRAEDKFEDILAQLLLSDVNLRRKCKEVEKSIVSPRKNPESYAKAYRLLNDVLKRLDEPDREPLYEALYQPSERGRANYVTKIIRESEQKAMAASAR